jgi:hypothetical protein
VTVTAASFRLEYPEFENAGDDLVLPKLAAAAVRTDARFFGAKYDHALGLRTADLLARSPFARDMQLIAKDDTTTYSRQLTELIEEVGSGPWLSGMEADGSLAGCP